MSKSRQDDIVRLVNEKGSIGIAELAKETYASPSTVRRDLEKLERRGLLRRHHGGAESVLSLRPPRIVRHERNQAEKMRVAARAAKEIIEGSTIFLDASTTVQYMIPHLSALGVTVYTNGADTAMRLAEAGVRTVSTGGELLAESMAYVGPVAADAVRRVYFDAVVFSSAAFDGETVSDWSEAETALRRTVLEQSARRYFLADHTKRGVRHPHIVCHIKNLDRIFCDEE